MSMANDRADLADLLDAIDGINGEEYRPDVLTDGDAWPRFVGYDRGPGFDFEATWEVVVVAPDLQDQDFFDWFAGFYQVITDALEEFAIVERIEPDTDGDYHVMKLTLRKEA